MTREYSMWRPLSSLTIFVMSLTTLLMRINQLCLGFVMNNRVGCSYSCRTISWSRPKPNSIVPIDEDDNEEDEQEYSPANSLSGGGGMSLDDVLMRERFETEEAHNRKSIVMESLPAGGAVIEYSELGGLATQKFYVLPVADFFVMVDVPPYTDALAKQLQQFLNDAQISAIWITNKHAIFSESDLRQWKDCFGTGVSVVMHRQDAVMKQRTDLVTQELDGYGPWRYDLARREFVEEGPPLVVLNWSNDKIMDLYNNPDINATQIALEEAQALRQDTTQPEGPVVAVYTPGHTLGSLCFVFEEIQACCTGHTLPDAQSKRERLDQLGSVVTSNPGALARQVQSARKLIQEYGDSFNTVLPTRHQIYTQSTKSFWLDRIQHFEKLTQIYTNLGILL